MTYIIIKCVEDECSADINLYDVTNTLPDCFNAREYEHHFDNTEMRLTKCIK